MLFNVYEVIPNYGEILFDVDVEDLKKTAEIEILKFKADIFKQTNPNCIITTEVRLGVFKDELISVCERITPFAVIMGSQGKSKTEHFFMGSHAGNSIHHFAWPIITVPSSATYSAIKKIGIAYDFEEAMDEDLIADIKFIAQNFNASIDILNAAHLNDFNESFIFLSRTLEYALKPHVVAFHFIASGQIEEGIIKFVEINDVDLLIVMPKHYNLFQKIFHRSHSKQLVLNCHVPVMSLSK